jgi:2-succinyl-5-enolpyruvyl-6-hydroxy-3-cyclohexene-1-carboxylate synthase
MAPMNTLPPSLACAATLVDELNLLGVTDLVLCPGSRSAPLAYAAADAAAAGRLRLWVRVDERSAGFFALGLAKASGRAAAVVTTSGTAVANLAPALLEARHSGVPLLAVTADRPATLVGTGANQTADQVTLLPGAAKLVVRVASADGSEAAWRYAARRAVVTAEGRLDRTPGPVHVNVELTPPLTGHPGPGTEPADPVAAGLARPPAPAFTCDPLPAPPPAVLAPGPRTVIVAGDLPPAAGRRWAERAAAAHVPLLAEPSSNARRGPAAVADYLAALPCLAPRIERVVVVGHPTLSRPITALLSRSDVEIIAVAPTGTWPDPGWAVSRVVPDADLLTSDPGWLREWQELAAPVIPPSSVILSEAKDLSVTEAASGPHIAALVLAALGPHDNLVLGSSAQIRHAERAPIHPDPPDVYANRGLAGIDGTLATALGLAAATGRPTTALVGDLTALHDLTSLVIPARERDIDLRVVIANDKGGAIFSTLEYAAYRPADLERLFTVPHAIDLAAAARTLGATAVTVTSAQDLAAALRTPWTGRHIIVASLA